MTIKYKPDGKLEAIVMRNWWNWWLKWWVWAGAVIFIILFFSRPPQLWFWLTIFVVIVLYGFERSLQ